MIKYRSKKLKPGELKKYLAEQRAIRKHTSNAASVEKAIRQARELDNWKRYIKSIQLETSAKHAAKATQGCFSPASPVEPQYQKLKRSMGVPLVIHED